MKITFCLASLGAGGAERVVTLLANRMNAMGHQIEIICLKYDDVYYQTDEGVKVVLAKHLGHSIPELRWLRKHICQEKPDVVIAFTEGVYCFTIAALLGTKIPVIASERLDPSAMTWKRNLLKRLLLPYADWLVVQTQSIKAYFPKKIQKKTSVIYNPVNEEVFHHSEIIPNREDRIVSVGRLFPQKNQQMMIRAFAKIADKYPDWHLVIYGEGPLRDNLESMVEELQLQDRVLLPGRTENVIEELRKSKIFCMSSDYEGMSNSMIEAICVGLPVVTTEVSGTDELLRNSENGLIVKVGDLNALARALSHIIDNQELRSVMFKNNVSKASEFSINTIVDHWIQLIKIILKS